MALIQTTSGLVQGAEENDYEVYKGIPYAKADRFQAPVSYRWDGIFMADTFGPCAYKTEGDGSEDCLYLNIYKPKSKKRLPVLIYVHGGAFQNGSGETNYRDFIEDDPFILVSFNYRLGVLGYLYTGKNTGNLGTLDQMAAIQWVYENIDQFGGDPDRITLMGESAGAKAIGALLSTPVKAYVNQIILISGAHQSVRTIETAKKVTEDYLTILGTTNIEELYTMPIENIIQAQRELCHHQNSTCMFGPVADDLVIPRNYFEVIQQTQMNAMMGSSLHELCFYTQDCSNYPQIASELFGLNSELAILQAQRLAPELGYEAAWIKVLSDNMYRTYTYRFADVLARNGSKVYLYSNEYGPAFHCLDRSIAFSNLDRLRSKIPGLDIDPNIRTEMRKSFVGFIIHGDPGFDCYTTTKTQYHFNTSSFQSVVSDSEALQDFPDEVYRR